MGGLSAPPPGNQAIKWPESETPAADHDAHVKAFRKRQLDQAIIRAATFSAMAKFQIDLERHLRDSSRIGHRKRKNRQAWTWKNHLANWINKTLNLLEKWGL